MSDTHTSALVENASTESPHMLIDQRLPMAASTARLPIQMPLKSKRLWSDSQFQALSVLRRKRHVSLKPALGSILLEARLSQTLTVSFE